LLWTLAAQQAAAQTPSDTLRQLDSAWARSYATNDTALAAKLFDDSVIVTSGEGRVTGKKEALADIGPARGKTKYFRTRDVTARVYATAGVVAGLAEWSFTHNGITHDYRRRYTALYARGGPLGWQIVALHIGPAPDE
jgi:ketosteroid isomerase-like protein